MGFAVPGMGARGCGYGASVAGHGVYGLWIWGEGLSLWENRRFRAQVAGYGSHSGSRFTGAFGDAMALPRGGLR